MALNNGQLIAGVPSSEGSSTFHAIEVEAATVLEPAFHGATPEEVGRACEAAQSAFEPFRSLPLRARARLLETIADYLDARVEDFVELTTRETGLPEARIRGELSRTTGQLRLFAGLVMAGDFLGVRIDTAEPGSPDLRQYRIPIGPVAIFAVCNFPLAFSVAGGDTASALAAGCPVVVKAHPAHPGTSALTAGVIAAAVKDLDMPAGIFSLLQGQSHAIGERLVRHPDIRAVGFTGSLQGGRALSRIAALRPDPIPVYAEMGSVNPLFLFPRALQERGADMGQEFVASLTLGNGQFCTNPGVVFAVSGEGLDSFLSEAKRGVDARGPGAMLHEGVVSGYRAGLERLDALAGVEMVAAGPKARGRAQARLYRTTLATLQEHAQLLLEELFGPVSIIVEVPDAAAFAQAVNALPGQLTATVHATREELGRNRELLSRLEKRAGRLLFGGYPTGVRVCHAMVHGGPYPATTSYGQTTSVGTLAVERFQRIVCYQDYPDDLLPEPLSNPNPLGLRRLVNGTWEHGPLRN